MLDTVPPILLTRVALAMSNLRNSDTGNAPEGFLRCPACPPTRRRRMWGRWGLFVFIALEIVLIGNPWRQMPDQQNALALTTVVKSVMATTKKIRPINFSYVGVNGLGHRLTKMASAFHLAVRINSVENITPDWKNCAGPPPPINQSVGHRSYIWDHLFGPQDVIMPDETVFEPEINRGVIDFRRGLCRSKSNVTIPNGTNSVRIINECPGYKSSKYVREKSTLDLPFLLSKQRTDEEFYDKLRSRFLALHKKRFDMFFEKNGIDLSQSLFVATDGPVVLHHINETIHDHGFPIKLVSLEQENIEFLGASFNLAGVSDDVKYQYCLKSWESSMLDMVLLSMADVVIAGVYSSYVQSMPLSLVLSRHGETKWASKGSDEWPASSKPFPPYCEVGPKGEIMTCHKNFRSVLGLNAEPNITTFQYRLQNDTAWNINSRHCHEFGVPLLNAPCIHCVGILAENNLC
eukprot:scaffold5140_cov53-Attheya_sp.AAC.4